MRGRGRRGGARSPRPRPAWGPLCSKRCFLQKPRPPDRKGLLKLGTTPTPCTQLSTNSGPGWKHAGQERLPCFQKQSGVCRDSVREGFLEGVMSGLGPEEQVRDNHVIGEGLSGARL